MNLVPGVKRVPTAIWMRPLGSTSSVGFTHTQAPSLSRLKSRLKSLMAIPQPAAFFLTREVGMAAAVFKRWLSP